jgi:hypothetical protein
MFFRPILLTISCLFLTKILADPDIPPQSAGQQKLQNRPADLNNNSLLEGGTDDKTDTTSRQHAELTAQQSAPSDPNLSANIRLAVDMIANNYPDDFILEKTGLSTTQLDAVKADLILFANKALLQDNQEQPEVKVKP